MSKFRDTDYCGTYRVFGITNDSIVRNDWNWVNVCVCLDILDLIFVFLVYAVKICSLGSLIDSQMGNIKKKGGSGEWENKYIINSSNKQKIYVNNFW